MINTSLYRYLLALVFVSLLFSACREKEEWIPGVPPANDQPPIARLNDDLTILYPNIKARLDGSKSFDPEGKPLRYTWRQISGPSLLAISEFNQLNSSVADVELYELGSYSIELTVTTLPFGNTSDTINIIFDNPQLDKKIFIREYGTNTAISGAEVEFCLDPSLIRGCRGQLQKKTSDVDGKINLSAKAISVFPKNLGALGYWDMENTPLGYQELFSGNYIGYLNLNYMLNDSLVIRPVPKFDIPVRVVDTGTLIGPSVQQYLGHGTLSGAYSGANYTDYLNELIPLRPGIDTAFRINVFGNMLNGITVDDLWDSSWGTPYPAGTNISFYVEKVFTRNTRDTLYIKY
jgi:hypothetical protein